MEYIKHQDIASIKIFDLRASESELTIYESCIAYVLDNCDSNEIKELTGCADSNELSAFREDLEEVIKKYIEKQYLPERYKNK